MGPIILLILLGLILLLVETLLLPGFFFTGILGVLSFAAACYFAFVNYGNTAGIITIIICVLVAAAFMVWILSSKTWKKATLNTEIKASVDKRPKEKGIGIGMKGVTATRLNPMGRVLFENGQETEVHSIDGLIEARSQVEVTQIDEEKIFVKLHKED